MPAFIKTQSTERVTESYLYFRLKDRLHSFIRKKESQINAACLLFIYFTAVNTEQSFQYVSQKVNLHIICNLSGGEREHLFQCHIHIHSHLYLCSFWPWFFALKLCFLSDLCTNRSAQKVFEKKSKTKVVDSEKMIAAATQDIKRRKQSGENRNTTFLEKMRSASSCF